MDNFVSHKYGVFKKSQFDSYCEKLRKKIFWLIIYTDENTNKDFKDINVKKYHEDLLFEISNCNELLFYPKDFVEVVNILDSALTVLKEKDFDFFKYRKLVFDAGALIQCMKVGDN